MPRSISSRYFLLAAFIVNSASLFAAEALTTSDTTKIEQLTGLKGKLFPEENVFKVFKPRTDVKIQIDKWTIPPFMGLTSWAAFTPDQDGQMIIMGDTVLLEDEVNPVMSVVLDAGLEVTALHNHFFFDQPKVYFMHIGGRGITSHLAGGIKRIYDKITEIRATKPIPATEFPEKIDQESKITSAPLETIFGIKGDTSNGMFKITVGRNATIHGVKVSKEMGINTWAAFAGSDTQAVIDGDFAVLESELQSTLKILRAGDINIVAIHQHMTHDQPHYFFIHYWGKGNVQNLARTIKSALDQLL